VEHLALDAGEREDRQVDRGDDATPNRLGRITSAVASATRSSARAAQHAPQALLLLAERRRQFSTMITAPSTIRPKSSAPRLIRLPLTPAAPCR
jgi:hypothetical protein